MKINNSNEEKAGYLSFLELLHGCQDFIVLFPKWPLSAESVPRVSPGHCQPRSGQPGVCLHSGVTGAGACQGELEGGRNLLQLKIEVDPSRIRNNEINNSRWRMKGCMHFTAVFIHVGWASRRTLLPCKHISFVSFQCQTQFLPPSVSPWRL